MDDPIQINNFIKHIINVKRDSIVGLALSKGGRMAIGKNRSKIAYVFSLLLIMGLPSFIKNSFITVIYKLKKALSKLNLTKNPSTLQYAKDLGIETFDINSPNNPDFQKRLMELKPDLIINQSQFIIKKKLLQIPSIGVINRHNALLPKNRGRLTPFWVLYKGEKETGVSIHFLTEAIDAGDIIVQEKYTVEKEDTFNTLVEKNYKIAPIAIIKAIEKLEKGEKDFLPNDTAKATYNPAPTFKDAFNYRKKRLFS